MKVQNLNKSSLKTKELIRHTFTKLAAEKGDLSKISVTELCKETDINRSTFYTHYRDIYEIAEEYQKDILNEVMIRKPTTRKEVFIFLDELYDCFHKNEESYRLFLSSEEPRFFLKQLRNKFVEKIIDVEEITNHKDPYIMMKIEMYVDGMAELMIRYFRKECQYDFNFLKKSLLAFAEEIF